MSPLNTALCMCFILIFIGQITYGYKIIFLLPLASRSHKNVFAPIIQELAARGHQITVVSPHPFQKPVANVKDIVIEDTLKPVNMNLVQDFIKYQQIHPILIGNTIASLGIPSCAAYLTNPRVKMLIESGKQFDLAIVNAFLNECSLATAPLLAQYIMLYSTVGLTAWNQLFVPLTPSYIPHLYLPYTSNMNIFQRLNNVVTHLSWQLIYKYYIVPPMQDLLSKHINENVSILDTYKQISFALTNADPVLYGARPSMPNVVNAGGIHCRKANPLPDDLEKFVEKSGENGFIFFSLGSNVHFKYLPVELKTSLMAAFSQLKQKVIVKCEEELKDLPANVKLIKWAPQQDLLGHPKIKAFITHGGLGSLQETVYHATPVVAIPLFADQFPNVARVEELEIGIKLDFYNISSNSVLEAVNRVFLPKYKQNMNKYSEILRDNDQHPVQKAAFWIEYVIKHKGAKHLRSAGQDLNFCQYFLLDVIGLILLPSITALWFVVKMCKKCKISRAMSIQKQTNKKNK